MVAISIPKNFAFAKKEKKVINYSQGLHVSQVSQVSQVEHVYHPNDVQFSCSVNGPSGCAPPYSWVLIFNVNSFSALYVNSFTVVGKKCMLLDACSILSVYKGVLYVWVKAVTPVTVSNAVVAMIPTTIMVFLFI